MHTYTTHKHAHVHLAGKMKGAESALELVHDTHFNMDSLMEGTLEHLHKKCRGFEAQLGQMRKVHTHVCVSVCMYTYI